MCPPGTDINEAMMMAVQLLTNANRQELLPAGSVSLIILLTDGDPTAGEGTTGSPGAHCPEEAAEAFPLARSGA